MERVTFDYSLKNIPIPSQKAYLIELINSVEKFRSDLSWRCHIFLNPMIVNNKKTFEFKTTNRTPSVPELKEFELELVELVKNVKFRNNVRNTLQNTLNNDMRQISRDNKLYVAADKNHNYYKVEVEEHQNLLHRSITKDYVKVREETVAEVNKSDKAIVEELELENRVYSIRRNEAFISLKDHKPNFANNPKCRLLNSAKSDVGKISKQILSEIVTNVRKKLSLNSWKNTQSVIDWFKDLNEKEKLVFIQFDVCDFYPSINRKLLEDALDFAAQHVVITEQERHIILNTKKGLLFHDNEVWRKKGEEPFDVTMGSWDGAEVCELIGIFLLSKLSHINLNIGLYRDDGLGVSRLTARQTEIAKKKLCSVFKEHGLRITIEANVKVVNFLDVTFDLSRNTYEPYMKPNNFPVYVHKKSNHPPQIIKNIPKSVNRRLSAISSNKDIFDRAAKPYQEALNKSGYDYTLNFDPPLEATSNRRKRSRKITYFNPPFSQNVKTKIGEKFFKILAKCFPEGHVLRKIINKNTVKLAYRCMPNMKKVISCHNRIVTDANRVQPTNPSMCNCQQKQECPLPGRCLTDKVVYQATVTDENQNRETYTGLTSLTFKERHYKHKNSFKYKDSENSTTLSTHIWDLKDRGVPFSLEWDIIDRAPPFNPTTRKCRLGYV